MTTTFVVVEDYLPYPKISVQTVSLILGNIIYKGRKSKVYQAVDSTPSPFAIMVKPKLFFLIPYQLSKLKDSLELLSNLSHPNIMRVYRLLSNEYTYSIQYELFASTSLANYIRSNRRIKKRIVMEILNQVTNAVAYIHSKGVAHRDLTLENILINKMNLVKIIGFSKAYSVDKGNYMKGLSAYSPPEGDLGHIDPFKQDIWALGFIIVQLFSGEIIHDFKEIDSSLLNSKAQELVSLCLEKEPSLRVSSKDLLDKLTVESSSMIERIIPVFPKLFFKN